MKKHVAVWTAACLGLVCSTNAGAVVGSGDASAYGAQASVNALASINITVTPTPAVSVTAPPPLLAPISDSLANLSVSDSRTILLTTYAIGLDTGQLSVNAFSDVDGLAGSRSATAGAVVQNLDFGVGTSVLGILSASTLHLTAESIGANTSVSGDAGSFSAAGSSVLQNAALTIAGVDILGLGIGLTANLDANPAPNTVLVDTGLIAVTLNRQVESCLAGDCSITVDAIAIAFTEFVFGGGVINGEVTIAHSEAHLAGVVPEPASMALVGTSLLGLVGLARRRSA